MWWPFPSWHTRQQVLWQGCVLPLWMSIRGIIAGWLYMNSGSGPMLSSTVSVPAVTSGSGVAMPPLVQVKGTVGTASSICCERCRALTLQISHQNWERTSYKLGWADWPIRSTSVHPSQYLKGGAHATPTGILGWLLWGRAASSDSGKGKRCVWNGDDFRLLVRSGNLRAHLEAALL